MLHHQQLLTHYFDFFWRTVRSEEGGLEEKKIMPQHHVILDSLAIFLSSGLQELWSGIKYTSEGSWILSVLVKQNEAAFYITQKKRERNVSEGQLHLSEA